MNLITRMTQTVWRQKARSIVCPPEPRLDGKVAMVTGGSSGIGRSTCEGLLQRGARVIFVSRNRDRGKKACEELGVQGDASFLPIDLSDLASVREGMEALPRLLVEDPVDVLICNAGMWPKRHVCSPQGHEIAFATNLLGHVQLLRCAMDGLLAPEARVVLLGGDIYCFARDCTPDYHYRTPLGGAMAYCRSKLGVHWLAHELQRRHPALHVIVVHPGVVASGLVSEARMVKTVSSWTSLDPDRGAQTTLYAATQEGLPKNAYLHNTIGVVDLDTNDPAKNSAKAEELWSLCESLCV